MTLYVKSKKKHFWKLVLNVWMSRLILWHGYFQITWIQKLPKSLSKQCLKIIQNINCPAWHMQCTQSTREGQFALYVSRLKSTVSFDMTKHLPYISSEKWKLVILYFKWSASSIIFLAAAGRPVRERRKRAFLQSTEWVKEVPGVLDMEC